ncbi:MAG: hypothetical protein Q9162_002734 [Coniocarpon cinnabarinum]
MASTFGASEKPGSCVDPAHPFISAKPPVVDHMTYLGLLEFNLTAENVVVLRHVLLEDLKGGGSLLNDIGWDLVGLLIRFVETPAAFETLLDVGKIGNPRECALKVEQALRNIDWELDDELDEEEAEVNDMDIHPAMRKSDGIQDAKDSSRSHTGNTQAYEERKKRSPAFDRFKTLLQMLGDLHPRIQVKQPSRFMATTLSAVLAAMAGAPPQAHQPCIDEVSRLVQVLKKIQEPKVPAQTLPFNADAFENVVRGADGTAKAQERVQDPYDARIQQKLLQSFVTHVVELWMSSLDGSLDEETIDVPAQAWAMRFQEQEQPRMIVPDRTTVTEQFNQLEVLKTRERFCEQLNTLSDGLGLNSAELLATAKQIPIETDEKSSSGPNEEAADDDEGEEDDPPKKPEDVPLSQAGCLFLLAYKAFTRHIESSHNRSAAIVQDPQELQIFPSIAQIIKAQIGSPESVMISTAAFPAALLDAILFLASLSLAKNAIGDPDAAFPNDKDAFARFLQVTSLVSANTPNSSIRYCAHVVTATVLRSHPDPVVRLNFIRDTLENAPMDLLRAEAVAWLKGELIEANLASQEDGEHSIFKTSMALDSVSMYLYPDLRTLAATASNSTQGSANASRVEVFTAIVPLLPFLLAVLNLDYLLLSVPGRIRERLDVLNLHNEADVGPAFLTPLRDAAQKADESLRGDPLTTHNEEMQQIKSNAMLLLQAIEQVERRLTAIAKEGK